MSPLSQTLAAYADGTLAPDRRAAVECALAVLPNEQRLAVALVLMQGLSPIEAADLIGLSVELLTVRLQLGCGTLEAILSSDDGAVA